MTTTQAARRRCEEHAKLVREAAKAVGSNKDPDAFDRAFRKVSRTLEQIRKEAGVA